MKAKTWLLLFILAVTISLQLVTSQLVNGIDWSTCPTSSRPTPLARTASVAIPPSFVSQIRNIFPEGKTPNSLLVNPDNDAFIIIESASNVTFTFILEGADYRNQFGYFIFDPLTRNVNPNPGYVPIFPDVSTSSRMGANGCLFSGVTVTVGPFPATTIIGFWVRADGYSNPSNADTWASYTTDVLTNVDGCRHIAWTKINGQVVIGFEDLKGLGDMDYNDVMFYFTTDGNFTASPGLVEVVNGTLQGCVRNDLRISTSYQCTQFAILDASSSLACQGFIKVPDAWILAPNDATTRSAVLSNPSLFTNPDGSSVCMVLADGTSVNNQWSPCFANTPPQVFSKDSTCYYVGCERKLLIKGMTSTSSCTGQRDLLCNPTVASSILSSSPDNFTASMSVFPQSWTIYLSDLLFGSASVNFSVTTLPQSSQRFDVMVLLDSNNMVSSDFDTVKNQIPNLLTSLSNKFARPPNVGFAIHTQLSASTYRLDILSRLTTDANQLSNAIRNVPSLATMTRFGNSQLIQSVQALASDNTVGWRGGNVFGTIIVVTVSSQQRDATLTANLKNALYGTGITPVYIVPEVNGGYNPYSEYNTFTNTTLKMGWSYQSSTFLWSSIALQGLDSYSTSIRFYPAPGDSFLFWSALPSPTTVSEACFASVCPFTGFTLTYPPTKPVGSFSFPLTASVNIPGVGAAQVNILSDRAPVVVDPFFVTNEDTKREFSLKDFASDEDGNSLRVTFLELPQGPIIVGDAYATLVNSYDISMAFSYTPPPNFFGQETALFRVTDGCKSSTIGTITFAVNSINDPPAAKGASFTIDQGASVDVDLSTLISDVEDDTSSLVVFINTLPKNSTLTQLLTNQVVAVTQTDVAISTKVRLTPQASWFGNTSFTYYARDSAGQVSNVGIISVQVIPTVPVVPVNHQPVCFNVVITGDESTTVTVDTIGGKDFDGSPISITLQSVVIVESYFLENITTDTGDITQNITIVGGELLMDEVSVTLPMDVTSGSLLTFSPIPDINGEVAAITYVVSDGVLLSEPCTATIFLIASNTSLSITSVNSDEFTLSEGSSFTIDFEQYIFSDGPTTVVLASLPTNGQLMTDSGVLAVGSSLGDNKTFTYVPDQYYNGNDNFDWYVIDNVNARADSSFNFIITLVNTPPSSANIVISTYRDSPVQISNFMVVDPDNKLADMALILLESTGFGTLSDKSKSAVSFPQTYSYGAWNFFWTAPADLPYFTSTQTVATYSFKLNDGIDDSPVYTITINLLYSNYPPTGADSVTVTSEDTPVKIVLQASDYESAPENLRLIIVSTAGNGNFYLDNAFSQLVVAGSQLPGKQIWFVPAPSAYSTDSPLATFSYFIVDEGSQISPVYKGSVYVNQSADLPRYSGALSFDVFEDGVLTMVFDDIAYANGTQATTVMTIVDGVSRGQLYECADNVDPCQKTVLISGSVVLNADKKLFFVPNPNDNGAAYTAFAFTLTNGDGVTKPYIVIINVIPVNDAPLITPGFPTMPDRVVFDEDTEYIFSWTVSDLDSPVSNISVKITSVVKNAKIFVCTSYADNKCEKGDEITPPVDVPYVTEGVWAVAYVPDPNAFDAHNFGWFNLVAEDDTGLRSPPIKTLIQVLPINDPPTIYAQYLSRSAYLDESGIPTVALYDIVIDDIDVGRNKLLMNITCTAGSNITIDHEGAFEDKTVNGRVIPAACTTITDDNGYDGVSCLESKEVINEILLKATRIQFETSYPSYQIYFTINDLGSTDKEDRPMESTLVLVASLESSLILIATNNTSDPTLTVTLSVSGGISVVVLILGIVLFSCKGNGDKIDTYFEGIAHSDPNGNKPNTEPVTETTIDGAGQGNRAALPVFGILVAAAAKKEKILYVPAVPADTTQPDYLATIDVDPMSPNYSKVIHRLPAPTAGDELRRLSWNVNTLKNRKYLIAPGMKSGNIHVIDTANPRAPSLHKTILGEDIMKSTGLTWPHAARCLPSGEILVSHMADKEGNAVGGFVSMTADFEVQGHWGKNSTQLGYSFAYQARTNAMISTGWGEPNAPKQAEGDAAPDRYGRSVWLWDMEKKEVLKSVDLGADGMMPLEVRFMHHPKSAHGFVCAALNGCVWHVYLDDNGEWQFERVIKIESISVEDWILPIMPALTTDLVISPDDKFLYISNWLHGDIRQYDITDPANPKLVSQLYLGGALRQDGGVKMTSGEEGTEVPMVKGRKLQGAPQSMQLSLDGTRLYVTNSFVSSWDMQFYPELESKGTQVLQVDVDAKDGGLKLNKEFLVDFADEPDGPAVAREMRLYEGDSTMDVCK